MVKAYRSGICAAIFLLTLCSIIILISGLADGIFLEKKPNKQKLDPAQAVCNNPLDVTSTGDDISSCGTLRYALAYLAANPNQQNKTITFSIPTQSRIILSGSGLSVPAGVTIQASCGTNKPDIILDGSGISGDGLVLGGQNVISGIKIGGFSGRQIIAGAAKNGNKLQCAITKDGVYDVTASQGISQSTIVGTAFSQPLQVTVRKWYGEPIVGVNVTFSAPGSGASGSFSGSGNVVTVPTDANGIAIAPTLTANTLTGSFQVVVSVAGLPNTVTFSLTNLPGAPASITATAGSSQSVTVGSSFPVQFKARVSDSFGNPITSQAVTFTGPSSGPRGTFGAIGNSITVYTDATGEAIAPTFTANTLPGSYQVIATVSGLGSTAIYSLTNQPGPPALVSVVAGGNQTAQVGTTFPTQFQTRVQDSFGNNLSGVAVTFTATGSGASGTFSNGTTSSNTTTDGNGLATALTFTANTLAGGYNVVASAAGTASTASFSLSNYYGPTTITAYMSNSNPGKYTNVAVYGKLIVNGLPATGATMHTTWNYKTTTTTCDGVAGSDGIASCVKNTGNVTLGYTVVVDVVMTYNGQNYYASTSFTPL